MEIIQHRDRRGNVWRFGIDCTPAQSETIRGALAAVRNMGGRAVLSISGILEAERNGPLYADIEGALLRGLAERFPAPQRIAPGIAPTPPKPQPVQEPQRTAPPMQSPAPVPEEPEQETRPGYWWENL